VIAYLICRLLALIPAMFVVVTVVFLLIHLIPGDPVAVMLGPDATPRQIGQVRSAYGLDLLLHFQLLKYREPKAIRRCGTRADPPKLNQILWGKTQLFAALPQCAERRANRMMMGVAPL
jgi:hypothetical protein